MATTSRLLADRVTLCLRSVDRIYLSGWVPKLQTAGQVCSFLLGRAALLSEAVRIPSPALFDRGRRRWVAMVERFARQQGVPIVRFARGECKEDRAERYFRAARREGRRGVVLIGVAQEKAMAWAGWRQGGSDEHPHFEFGRQSRFVNYYYFYILDPEWGKSFIKFCSYAPYSTWVYLNGHERAKAQCEARGIACEQLDNGFAWCADPAGLQAICDALCERQIAEFYARWMKRLPSPFLPAEREAGYGHRLSLRQLEVADTRVFDRPAAGRAWFEQTIPDQLALGRPDQLTVVFDRRVTARTPGRFRSRVVNRGSEPSLAAHYKSSKIKQYLKQGRALRTETTINDPRDFGVGRLLTAENLGTLVAIGQRTNQRLLAQERASDSCAPDASALERIVLPSTCEGQPAPALRFGDPRVMALFASLCAFAHIFAGLTNRSLRELIAGFIPGYGARNATYDLRRLVRNGLIRRIPRSHRYELTDEGRRLSVFFTKTYTRIVNPSLTELDPKLPDEITARMPLARAWRAFERALEDRIATAAIA